MYTMWKWKTKIWFTSPVGTEWDSERSHYTTQDNKHFKTNELLIYGIFHEKKNWIAVAESKSTGKKRLLYICPYKWPRDSQELLLPCSLHYSNTSLNARLTLCLKNFCPQISCQVKFRQNVSCSYNLKIKNIWLS